jgi:MFS family permease
MEENISNDSVEHIRAADPRSMPAETGLSPARKSSVASKSYTPGPLIQRVSTSFTTLEPFDNPTSRGVKRESSAKSPGRVSPAKKVPGTRDSSALQDAPYNGRVPLPRADSAAICKRGHSEDEHVAIKARMSEKSVPSKREVRKHIKTFRNPPIQPRASSLALRKQAESSQVNSRGYQVVPGTTFDWQDIDHERMEPCSQLESEAPASALVLPGPKPSYGQLTGTSYSHSLDGTLTNSEEIDFSTGFVAREHGNGKSGAVQGQAPIEQAPIELKDTPDPNLPPTSTSRRRKNNHHDLRGKTHVSLREHKGFSLARSHKRQKIARDWSPGRKRFSAAVACISTALVGILAGIYAGEVPAIQYYIVDFHHYTVLGNVFFFIALSVPTFFFWPLPLLHGRKPYILGAMATAMPLLFPQAIAVGQFRSPYVSTWRVGLILSRALMGFCLGFANMNFKSTLTDLFGASLQSENPHQEVVDEFDVRRHGGGMGVWLGLWTWSAMGSIGVGFMAGAVIINSMTPAWGFYISIMIIALVLLLNIVTPEVRRSAYRRSVAEIHNETGVSRRLARGEVKMHMVQTGPKWWGEEFHYGVMLSAKMLRQPGFLIMSLYVAWMYAQIVLIIVASNTTQDLNGSVLTLCSFLGL